MKASAVCSALAAVILMFGAVDFVRADGGGNGSNQGNNNQCNNNNGQCNQGNNNNGQCNQGNNNNGQCNQNQNNNVQIRLRTNLAGSTTGQNRPEGNADFRNQNGRMRLQVEVENLNLPAGTVLTVAIVHAGVSTTAGMIKLNGGGFEGELELDSQNGDLVPTVMVGDMITVSNGAAVVLAGAF